MSYVSFDYIVLYQIEIAQSEGDASLIYNKDSYNDILL